MEIISKFYLLLYEPNEDNILDTNNPYHNEAGFLSNFTAEERKAVKSRTNQTEYHEVDGQGSYTTEDKVFFLSEDEYEEYKDEGLIGARKPTTKAVENSTFSSSNLHPDNYWWYWLRSASSNSDGVRNVRSSGFVDGSLASYGNYGVSPALSLNLESVIFKSGLGTESNPYEVTGKSSEGHIYLILAVVIIGTAALFILLKSKKSKDKSKVSIENEDEKNKLNVKFCSKCGKELNIQAKFCEKCGHQLDDNNL